MIDKKVRSLLIYYQAVLKSRSGNVRISLKYRFVNMEIQDKKSLNEFQII